MKILKSLLFALFLGTVLHAQEQRPAFWSDIQAFKKQDSIHHPPKNAILFVGSSSFTKWTDVQNYFPGYVIINRGFGGSSLTDLIRYENDVIFKYQPKQIVMYCGENDIAGSDTVTGQIVFARFKKLYRDIRSRLPRTPLVYISMKPSPSRWVMRQKMMTGNDLIRDFLRQDKNSVFVSVWKAMLGPDGQPVDGIYVEDKLHMNAKGYAIWKRLIGPYLKK